MTKLKNWRATRSGASITVRGEAPSGGALTIANVAYIEPTATGAVAVTKDGARYPLEIRSGEADR